MRAGVWGGAGRVMLTASTSVEAVAVVAPRTGLYLLIAAVGAAVMTLVLG